MVLTSLDLSRSECRDVVHALRTLSPRTPLVVEASPQDAARYPELLGECDVLPGPAALDELVIAVADALERPRLAAGRR